MPHTQTDQELMREYVEMLKAGWGMFGGNADRRRAEIATELHSRGITETPNIFGAIKIHGRPTPRT